MDEGEEALPAEAGHIVCLEEEEEDSNGVGSVLPKSQAETQRSPALSLQTEDPRVLMANPTPEGILKPYPDIFIANTVELPAVQHGCSEHLDPVDGSFSSEDTIMSSALGGTTEFPTRNLPADQPVQGFMDVRWGVSMYAVQQHNYNFLELHSPVELQMESYQQQNHGLQTQMAGELNSSRQRVEWLHLQQQGYVYCNDVVPENNPYASGAPPFVEFTSNVSQQVIGAHGMLSSATMNSDAVPAPASFSNTVLPNFEASQLAEGGDPFGPAQLSARAISPDQYTQASHNNRTLALDLIYDPMYEALGQPVDPYLRLFLMSRRRNCS
ncbi:hypothetical protein MLD38_016827 [Melastoma candidum]|uniref:Uncharacterized protein n=1 Tax=Melastoma candidum TaxID=119954 RepID=A0ACB9QNP4_9MYRT|nr:hypothetical protein MLD38_016827 [Melastoma candidum]